MRRVARPGLRWSTLAIAFVFLLASLIPDLSHPRPAYAGAGTPQLPIPEDPLGQQPEPSSPEISISVDVRDGHLTVRVVDIWGPGRIPLVFRTYNNAAEFGTSSAGGWQLNHLLDLLNAETNTFRIREPDGNRSNYVFSSGNTYVKSVGTYSMLTSDITCEPSRPGDQGLCTWQGATVSLPKGVTRRFNRNAPGSQLINIPGLIVQETDGNGNVTSFTWTSFPDQDRAYIATVRDPVGRVVTYGYERYGTATCAEEGDERCVRWVYPYRVRTITDPYGRTATYTYDGNGQLVSVLNAAGRTTSYGYSGNLLVSLTNARGYATSFQWASGVYVTRVTAPDGTYTSYANWGSSRTSVTNARGQTTQHDLSGGNVVAVTDPLGNVTRYAYDSRANVTEVTDPRGNRTTYAYNGRNKVTQVVQAAGSLNLTSSLSWDGADNLLSVTNPRGIRTDYTYSSAHNLTSVRRAAGTGDEALTQYTYTAWGGVASVLDARGYTTTFGYTARRQLQTVTPPAGGTTSYGYNGTDDQVTMTDGNGRVWSTAYDASRLVTSGTDPLGNVVRHEYDANGNRTRTYDARNNATTFAYDVRDRLTSITDALNGVTRYEYDAVGNLTRITNARNSATTFTYDAANRLTQVNDALGQITTSGYDAADNRISMRDRRGTTHTYAYDQANRLTQVSGGGLGVSYTYDAAGNRLTMADSTGTTTYQYDSLDRLTRTVAPPGRSVQYTYSVTGQRTSLTYPGGTISQTYSYDPADRLTAITQGSLQWTFSYDAAGNRTQMMQPNGTRTTYSYLGNNWLSGIVHQRADGSTLESTSYTYDAAGNRVSQADRLGTSTYAYDTLNRLTGAVHPGSGGTWSWTYDTAGNRTQQTGPGGTVGYTYDANNRLTQAGVVGYAYDSNGNLISTTAGQSFAYDAFNRLTQAAGSGGTATYTYNGDGLKTQRSGPDGATLYYYDGFRPIWETDGAGAMTAQLDRDIFGNLLSRREASGSRRYLHADGLGSTTALTNESGTLMGWITYTAWGENRGDAGEDVGKYRFTGAERDSASGLYHMGARFYDPGIGRWLSEDPVQDRPFEPSSLNIYVYAANNPLVNVDPAGTTEGKVADPSDEILERAASRLGIPVAELRARLKDLSAWFENNLDDILNAAGLTAGIATSTAAALSVAVVAGLASSSASKILAASGVSAGVVTILVTAYQLWKGTISAASGITAMITTAIGLIPAYGAAAVAKVLRGGPVSGTGQSQIVAWALSRGIGLVAWIFPWRKR